MNDLNERDYIRGRSNRLFCLCHEEKQAAILDSPRFAYHQKNRCHGSVMSPLQYWPTLADSE